VLRSRHPAGLLLKPVSERGDEQGACAVTLGHAAMFQLLQHQLETSKLEEGACTVTPANNVLILSLSFSLSLSYAHLISLALSRSLSLSLALSLSFTPFLPPSLSLHIAPCACPCRAEYQLVNGRPPPPTTWTPPLGTSSKTWANILKNKDDINFCVTQFHYFGTRIKCITHLTGGPFLS